MATDDARATASGAEAESADVEVLILDNFGGGPPPLPPVGHRDDGDPDPKRHNPSVSGRGYYIAVALGIVSITVFFSVLAVTFLFRRVGGAWVPLRLPNILWWNTLVLLLSSWSMESARRRLAAGDERGFEMRWRLTTVLGLVFLAGQVLAWQRLVAQGFYLATNPASSFFYISTALHGIHLLAGLVALFYVLVRKAGKAALSRAHAARAVSFYWHFMDGLWVALLAVLFFAR